MNKKHGFLTLIATLLTTPLFATTYYTDAARPDNTGDGLSWETARQTLQSAVNLASNGDTVLVADGVYNLDSESDSRVDLPTGVTLQSANGPETTIIDGCNELRGVFMNPGAQLIGFSIIRGQTESNMAGAGICAQGYTSDTCLISNCVVTACQSLGNGGGAYLNSTVILDSTIEGNECVAEGGGLYLSISTAERCIIKNNAAAWSGGGGCFFQEGFSGQESYLINSLIEGSTAGSGLAFYNCGTVRCCTIVNNTGYGTRSGATEIKNSIIWGNTDGDVLDSSALSYSCASDLIHGSNHCITNNPAFSDSSFHLRPDSPCRRAGSSSDLPAVDLVGSPRWMNGIDIGAYAAALPIFVDQAMPDDTGDGLSWETAKHTLQAGVDAAAHIITNQTFPIVEVWVAPGTYNEGGAPSPNATYSNRVCITENIQVYAAEGTPVIDANNIMRGAYLAPGAILKGFLITRGKTTKTSGLIRDVEGGGVYMDPDAQLINCSISDSSTHFDGGGAYVNGGTIDHCSIYRCEAGIRGGGVHLGIGARLKNTDIMNNHSDHWGGGIFSFGNVAMQNCIIRYNESPIGGGIFTRTHSATTLRLRNLEIAKNTAANDLGAGLYVEGGAFVNHCTIVDNNGSGLYATNDLSLVNSIIWGNINDLQIDGTGNSIRTTCAANGVTNRQNGCLSINPLFDPGATSATRCFLSEDSPAINAAAPLGFPGMLDLSDARRIQSGAADLGAYESAYDTQTTDTDLDALPDAWETTYYPNIASCDGTGDLDNDSFSDFDEYIANTNPDNDQSFLSARISPAGSHTLHFDWTIGPQRTLFLERADTLNSEFKPVWSSTNPGTGTDYTLGNYYHESWNDQQGFFRIRAALPNDNL